MLAPPPPDASVEERRRYAYAPLAPPSLAAARGLCLATVELSTAALEMAASFAAGAGVGGGSAGGGAPPRQVVCIVADARHPLVYAPPSLYQTLRGLEPAPPELVICLTKVDLVSSEHLASWTRQLERRYLLDLLRPLRS